MTDEPSILVTLGRRNSTTLNREHILQAVREAVAGTDADLDDRHVTAIAGNVSQVVLGEVDRIIDVLEMLASSVPKMPTHGHNMGTADALLAEYGR